jgi:uncharacterized SAM-binding protein YcdF (DUF218 family)
MPLNGTAMKTLVGYGILHMADLEIDRLAKIIWDYHHVGHKIVKSDAIFALGSMDTRVAERAAQLYLDGLGAYIIFSGGAGTLTKDKFMNSEAEVFANIAIELGVPKDNIIIENQSTNTGKNIQFTYKVLQDRGLSPKSLILVQKPYMERRTYATFKKQWPDPGVDIIVTSPQISYDQYFNDMIPKELALQVMVGDMQRIKEYPILGFQIEQEIPPEVWQAYQRLTKLGYTKHLIK